MIGGIDGAFPVAMVALAAVYAAIVLVIAAGIARVPRSRPTPNDALPRVSIIVACRNEETDLPACLASLAGLDYPRDRLEVWLIDDQSTDGTAEVIHSAVAAHSHFHALSTADQSLGTLRAKARGVALGARHATGEWLFITDADAEVHPGWLRHMLSGVGPQTGIIGGFLRVRGSSAVGIAEKLAWGYTLPFAFGMAGWGGDFICVGPNMGVRRSVYEDAGGLERAPFTIAEDLALFLIVVRAGYGVLAQASPETTVQMAPVESFRQLFGQQRRWLKGGFEAPWYYAAGLLFTFGFHFALSLVLLLGWFVSVPATLAAWALKFLADSAIIIAEVRRTGDRGLLALLPLVGPYTMVSFLWLPISFLVRRDIRWQGAGYSVSYDAPESTRPS